MKKLLSGPQRKFCELYALEKNGTAAYLQAYPGSSAGAARSSAPVLLANPRVQAEIERIRSVADSLPGSAVLTRSEKRNFAARLLRANPATLDVDVDGDLLSGLDYEKKKRGKRFITVHKLRLCNKLDAIKVDNDLAGDGSEAESQDAITELLDRIRK